MGILGSVLLQQKLQKGLKTSRTQLWNCARFGQVEYRWAEHNFQSRISGVYALTYEGYVTDHRVVDLGYVLSSYKLVNEGGELVAYEGLGYGPMSGKYGVAYALIKAIVADELGVEGTYTRKVDLNRVYGTNSPQDILKKVEWFMSVEGVLDIGDSRYIDA